MRFATLQIIDLHVMLKQAAEHLRQALRTSSVTIFTRASLDQAFWATAQAGGVEEIVGRVKFASDSRVLEHMKAIFDPWSMPLPEKETAKPSTGRRRVQKATEIVRFISRIQGGKVKLVVRDY